MPLLSQKLYLASVTLSQSTFTRTWNWISSEQIVIQCFDALTWRRGRGCIRNSFIQPILNRVRRHSNIIKEEIICPYLAILD